jgi:hypothetical protein
MRTPPDPEPKNLQEVLMARRRAAEPAREVSPLTVYRAEQVEIQVVRVTPFEDAGAPATPLEMYGAVTTPDLSGWWVYVFVDQPGSQWSDGLAWYAGQSDHLWSRWRDHYYKYLARFEAAVKWRIRVANQAEADLIELACIHFYQPECNDKGRAADLEAKVRRWSRGGVDFNRAQLDSRKVGG